MKRARRVLRGLHGPSTQSHRATFRVKRTAACAAFHLRLRDFAQRQALGASSESIAPPIYSRQRRCRSARTCRARGAGMQGPRCAVIFLNWRMYASWKLLLPQAAVAVALAGPILCVPVSAQPPSPSVGVVAATSDTMQTIAEA